MNKSSYQKVKTNALRWFWACLLVLAVGCSSDEPAQQAECTGDADCTLPMQCNVILGVCEYVRTEPTRPTNPEDLSDVGTDTGNESQVDAEVEQDVAEPGADVVEEPDVSELTMCEAISQSCDLSRPVQGEFVCVEGGGLGSICLKACTQPNHPSTCDPGFYCREYQTGGTTVLGCAIGGCETNRDCDHISILGGNCVDQGNGYKECVEGGTLLEGQACRGGAEDRCMEGTRCRVTNTTTGAGVCSQLCNPWSPIHTCPGIQFCEPTTTGQGICTDNVSDPGYYSGPYEHCSRPGALCDNGAKCLRFAGFWGDDYYCVPYCRAGMNDCSGVYGPGLFGGATYCDLNVFSNTNQIGYCYE